MRIYLVKICIEDASEARTDDRLALSKQLTANIRKEDLLCDNTVLAVSEIYIDGLYYNKMFNSVVCWKNAAAVDRKLENLNSKPSKVLDFKVDISMRLIGLGWEYLSTN